MKLIFQAILKAKKNIKLLILSVFVLFFLTIANQLEMFALGAMADSGPDFFALFQKEQVAKGAPSEGIALKDIEKIFPEIDKENKGHINRQDVANYFAKKKTFNPLEWLKQKAYRSFHFSTGLKAFIAVLITVALFKALMLFLSAYLVRLVAIRFSKDLRLHYFEHLQTLSLQFFQKHHIGAISSRIVGDSNQIAVAINTLITNFLQTPFNLISTLILCIYISWKLSLCIFVIGPAVVVPSVYLARRVKRVSRQIQVNQEGFATVILDFLKGIHTVKLFGMESATLKKYKNENLLMSRLESRNAMYATLTRPILHAIGMFGVIFVILGGTHMFQMSLGEIIPFCGMLALVYEPIKKMAQDNAAIQMGVVAAERLFEVLNLESEVKDLPGATELKEFKESIEFRNVSFKYEEQWVLKDLSFTIKKGESVALVGATGAGKSTVAQLLPRLYDVQEGEILIDGKPITSYTQKSLREQMSFVSQKPFLFLDTVQQNISFGTEVSKEEVVDAAKRASADEFIEKLPRKYETMILDGGQNFSGGQQQRLAIARALLKGAPILVLDEATSALDALSERKIKEAIGRLHGSVTQLIIAHRLTTIEHVDRIIYMEEGKKIAEGTKEELLQSCPPFRQVWEMNFEKKEKSAELIEV